MPTEAERRLSKIELILNKFDERAGGLVALAVLMKSGLPVAAQIRVDVDETFLSASLAALLEVAVNLSERLFTLKPARLILDTEAGSLILRGIVGQDMVIAAIFKKQHLGAMLLHVEQAARQIGSLF